MSLLILFDDAGSPTQAGYRSYFNLFCGGMSSFVVGGFNAFWALNRSKIIGGGDK